MELKGYDRRVEAFREGDRETLERIYRGYRQEVEDMLRHGFTFSSGGKTVRFQGFREPFRLREMVQDSFIHAFRERVRQGYDPSRSYRPYLLTVVRNHLIDRFRRRQLESDLFVSVSQIADDDETDLEVLDRMSSGDDDRSPELDSLRRELHSILEQFLDSLDDTDRQVVKLYMLGDHTQHEMADHLGTNRNRVRKRIRLIREQLLGHLKREGFIGSSEVEDVFRNINAIALLALA